MHTAEELCRRGLAMAAAGGHTSLRESVAHCIYGLARVLHRTGRMAEADAVFREALHMFGDIHGKMDHRDVAACQTSLAYLLSECRDKQAVVEAERHFTAAIAMYRRMLGTLAHPDVAHAQRGLGLLYRRQGREAEAGELLASALAMHEAVLRTERPTKDDISCLTCEGQKSKPAIQSATRVTKNESRTRASVEPESKRTPTAGRALDDPPRGAGVEHASGR